MKISPSDVKDYLDSNNDDPLEITLTPVQRRMALMIVTQFRAKLKAVRLEFEGEHGERIAVYPNGNYKCLRRDDK